MTERDPDRREDLRRRLRRMGLLRGTEALPSPSPRRHVAIESLVDGDFHDTPHGRCFVARTAFPSDFLHGDLPLSSFLDLAPAAIATVADDPALVGADLREMLFLDTETTGLSGGTGTMAFLVGLGFFEGDEFCLLQPFLRDPGDELAMIHLLESLLSRFRGLVTFNGRAFDLRILETRFILASRPLALLTIPHLDLLPPARRLWRLSLPSCGLGMLEREVLGVQRDQADVPSGEIPRIYRDYLRTGDAREISRVLYHNWVDILSMVTLAARLTQAFTAPWQEQDLAGTHLYSLSRWYRDTGRDAERALRAALVSELPRDLRLRALEDLALLLKREGRRAEAVEWWQQLAVENPDDVVASVELAKTFEWQLRRLELAVGWTELALARAENWTDGWRREQTLAELQNRLERLRRKRRNGLR
jgi:uncharacterized protein YprB with RNaseH-like and TPR domain